MKSAHRLRPLASAAVATLALLLPSGYATAQPQPGQQPLGPGTGPRPDDKKPDGIAEKAPMQPGQLPTTPVLPAPKARSKRFQMFELGGYFRWRGDWMKNFHLGFDGDDPTTGLGVPFTRAISCGTNASVDDPDCSGTIKSSNIRLRLEPVINIDERSSVHMQIDILDNLVLGSTPDGYLGNGASRPPHIPLNAFSGSQVPPEAGRNSVTDSIVVRRAWAEVMTPLGVLRFGRMPSHWGMGLLANGGGADPFRGTYDLDSDYGDTADRLLFGTMIPGTDIRFAIAMDWASTVPTGGAVDLRLQRFDGQPRDLDDRDDVNQWVIVLARLDDPDDFQDLIDQGEMALNYGAYFVYRTQSWDYTPNLPVGGIPTAANVNRRGGKAYIPDIWVHFGHKKFDFEMEAVAILGSIEQLDDIASSLDEAFDVRQFGGVARASYLMADDKLKLGLELGFASGDQWDNSPPGRTNISQTRALPCLDIPATVDCSDHTISAFRFDFDYEIDLILFRELIGTVTNAIYVKPTLKYQLTKSITFSFQNIISFAHKPISTPGNGTMYGIEFDGDLGYENEGFFAGISYGILFPLSAMNHPVELGFNDTGGSDAGNAQTIQSRFVLKF